MPQFSLSTLLLAVCASLPASSEPEPPSTTPDEVVRRGAEQSVPQEIFGDFNRDGKVDDEDLVQWQGDFANGGSDADLDGDSDGNDFLSWQRFFGGGSIESGPVAPEPDSICLLLIASLWLLESRRLRRQGVLANSLLYRDNAKCLEAETGRMRYDNLAAQPTLEKCG